MRRPWHIEYMNAEGAWKRLDTRTFRWRSSATRAMSKAGADQPGVLMRVEKHVSFDAGR